MVKKNKVIDLFGTNRTEQNTGVKYSELLNDFIKPFDHEFPEDFDLEDIFEFALNAWNMANMSLIIPKEEFDEIISGNGMAPDEARIFKGMLRLKNTKYKKYDRFIRNFTLFENEGFEAPGLNVVTVDSDTFIMDMMNDFNEDLMGLEMEDYDEDHMELQFRPGFINRSVIMIKGKRPFLDLLNEVFPEDGITEIDEANAYLVSDEIKDLEKWLKKRFDIFFKMELQDWEIEKKYWPIKRTYKMFQEWFEVGISTMPYDLDRTPIFKE